MTGSGILSVTGPITLTVHRPRLLDRETSEQPCHERVPLQDLLRDATIDFGHFDGASVQA